MSAIDNVGGWPAVLGRLANGNDLSADECRAVLGSMLSGEASDAQIAAFIVGLRIKGETVDEMIGMQAAMMDVVVPVVVPAGTIDIVGAGGAPSRRSHALNVSTMASFVAAGAGATICKHGNLKASSTSGSFDLLTELGINFDLSPDELSARIRDIGIGFVFARAHHPSMRHVGPVRAELGIPTVFNILGPLSNPGRVRRQVIGTADWSIARRMAEVLQATGSIRALVVHGEGSLDELTTTGTSKVVSVDGDSITEYEIDAEDLGLARVTDVDLAGGDAATNAAIAAELFAGADIPARGLVAFNAAAGLVVAGLADDFEAGIGMAFASIDEGRAKAKLDQLVAAG